MQNLLDRKWSAVWIENTSCPAHTAPIFLKTFTIDHAFSDASLYICGLGFYTAYINGRRVGNELLNPAFTAYDKTTYYNVLDVGEYLIAGENQIEITLGNGWFNEQEPNDWQLHHAPWRKNPQLICELLVDGRLALISDSSWDCCRSQITYNSLRFGETFDASIGRTDFHKARVSRGAGGLLTRQTIPPIRLQEILAPAAVIPAPNGAVTYDFGVNLSGNAEITVRGQRGGKVTIVYAERIFEDGSPDMKSVRGSTQRVERFQRDEYILSGHGDERWHSEFGYNGFRYAHVTCENAELTGIAARCFHTDLKKAGSFTIDHPLVTRLQSAILRSTRTNFHHIPTDCPHREKNGWTGDAHLSCEQALFNFDMKEAYMKWMGDLIDSQRPDGELPGIAPTCIWGYNWGNGPTWDIALFEIPWQTYLFTGDQAILEKCIGPMKKYLSFLSFTTDNGIWRNALGDWCAPAEAPEWPREILVTAYAWRAFDLYAKAAAALNMTDEADAVRKQADEIRRTFIRRFTGPDAPDTQTYLALLLAFGLTDEPKDELVKRLERAIDKENGHMMCGIFGAKLLYNALTDCGRFDLAWKMLNAEGYPGWSDMLSRCPSTLSEDWLSESSQNHHMYSAIGDWFYKGIAGIHPDEAKPGFRHVFIAPHIPDGCASFCAEHDTPLGRLAVIWNGQTLTVTLPEGSSATLTWKNVVSELGSGTHIF